jgi:hypothetical protein
MTRITVIEIINKAPIVRLKNLRDWGNAVPFDTVFTTEIIRIELVIINTKKNPRKIVRFVRVESSMPLYDKNFTMVESITAIIVKIKIRTREFFLVMFRVE